MANIMQIPVHGLGNDAGSELPSLYPILGHPDLTNFPAATLVFFCFHKSAKVFPTMRAFKPAVASAGRTLPSPFMVSAKGQLLWKAFLITWCKQPSSCPCPQYSLPWQSVVSFIAFVTICNDGFLPLFTFYCPIIQTMIPILYCIVLLPSVTLE